MQIERSLLSVDVEYGKYEILVTWNCCIYLFIVCILFL